MWKQAVHGERHYCAPAALRDRESRDLRTRPWRRVATRVAKDHPKAVDRLAGMDNIRTGIIFERMNSEIARGHWFFIFDNVPDLPEALISGREEVSLRFIFSSWRYHRGGLRVRFRRE